MKGGSCVRGLADRSLKETPTCQPSLKLGHKRGNAAGGAGGDRGGSGQSQGGERGPRSREGGEDMWRPLPRGGEDEPGRLEQNMGEWRPER